MRTNEKRRTIITVVSLAAVASLILAAVALASPPTRLSGMGVRGVAAPSKYAAPVRPFVPRRGIFLRWSTCTDKVGYSSWALMLYPSHLLPPGHTPLHGLQCYPSNELSYSVQSIPYDLPKQRVDVLKSIEQ